MQRFGHRDEFFLCQAQISVQKSSEIDGLSAELIVSTDIWHFDAYWH